MTSLLSIAAADANSDEAGRLEAASVRPVERGAFARLEMGPAFWASQISGRDYGFGLGVGVGVGYDIAPVFTVTLGVTGLTAASKGPDQRDLLFLMPRVQLQAALMSTPRWFVWAQGQAGYALGMPESLDGTGTRLAEPGPTFGGAIGLERFSKLRRFAYGIRVGADALLVPDLALAVSVTPTLRYTF